jgi:hypothetical protein
MTRRPTKTLLLAMATLLAGVVAILPARTSYADTSSAEGLELSPAIVNLNADAGKTYTVTINVMNTTSSRLSFTTSTDDFGSKDETGTPSIILNADGTGPTSIKQWVATIPSFTLAPHEKEPIKAIITVPANAEAGGHYGVVRFSGTPTDANGSTLGLVASAGTLVLVRVSGDIHEDLKLTTFSAASHDEKEGTFFENGPLKFVERFTNTGNVHVQPVGQIEIRDTFGNLVTTLKVNDAKGNVLPGGVRRFEQDLDKYWLFGHYTANLSIAYGTQGEAIVNTISFWVIPYKLTLLAIVVLITILYVFTKLIKRYNTFIINRAKNNHEKTNSKNKTKRKS